MRPRHFSLVTPSTSRVSGSRSRALAGLKYHFMISKSRLVYQPVAACQRQQPCLPQKEASSIPASQSQDECSRAFHSRLSGTVWQNQCSNGADLSGETSVDIDRHYHTPPLDRGQGKNMYVRHSPTSHNTSRGQTPSAECCKLVNILPFCINMT